KYVSVVEGEVWDVAVDIRRGSPTFGRWTAVVLSAENRRHFWIPEGFAHGFVTLSERAVFTYLCTATYDREADAGIRWNDASLAVDWPVADPVLSGKDAAAPFLADVPEDRLPVCRPWGCCCSVPTGRAARPCAAGWRRWARSWAPRAAAACPMAEAASARTSTSPRRCRRWWSASPPTWW